MLNRTNKIPVFLLAGVLILIFALGLFAREDPAQINRMQPYLAKPNQDRVFRSLCNVGNWAHWIDYDGRSAHTPGDNSGGFYPRGTAAVIYLDGLVWAGYVRDGSTQNPRVGGVTYNVGTSPGWIVTPGTSGAPTAVAVDPGDARVMVYRIRRDWQDLTLDDVKRDAAELNEIDIDDVSDGQAQQVLDDYEFAWNNWPADVGAPYYDLNDNDQWDAGVDEPGIADADQVIWFAVNDLIQSATIGLYGSDPMGIEQQTTLWAYNQPGATLGQLVFKKFKFINKSGVRIDTMYVAQWSDPDIGTYTDDLAGCDTTRSLGYGYSGFVTDGDFSDFGLPPATVGYDFFQGPIVPSPGDTAIFDLQKLPDFRNLPMTSFGWFASGSAISDPDLGDYDGTLQWYNLIRGYIPNVSIHNPTPFTYGNQGDIPTLYPLAGDPFRGTGDIDATLGNFQPGDRRITLCSGPFTMEPGDIQEVVVAVVGGIVAETGGNNVNAVEQMKLNDDFAQFVYDNLFQALPKAPAAPKVKVTELQNQIMLDFGSDLAGVAATEANDPVLGFNFEGYNIYQKPTATATKEQSVLIATYDLINQVRTIRGSKFIASFGDILEVPLQKGTDNGIQRYFLLEKDYINDVPLYNGNTYYFAVTAFNYNDGPVPEPTLESGLDAIVVVPQHTNPGVRYGADVFATLDIEHTAGASDGVIEATVIDPAATTGHQYEVFFTEDTDTNSATFGELLWSIRDVTSGEVKISNQVQVATLGQTETQPIFDGLQVKVTGPALDFKSFQVVANANGPLDPPEQGCFAFNNNGFPFLDGSDRPDGARQQANGSTWGINHSQPGSPGYNDFVARVTQYTGGFGEAEAEMGLQFLIPRDYEIRFTGTPGPAFYRWPYLAGPNPAFMGTVPFELWCIGDVAVPGDDFQCLPWISDDDSSGTFNLQDVDHTVSGGANDPFTDPIYWLEPLSRDQTGYDALLAAHNADPAGANSEVLWAYKTAYDPWNCVAGMMRMVLVNWNGGDVGGGVYDADMPEDGTIFRIITAKPNLVTDVFTFTAPEITELASDSEQDVENVNVFPNPYYAFNSSEPDRFTHFVTFNHLPANATIRIFNLSGVQVRKIERSGETSQFERWDLTNERNIPVASGMYIAHIDMPDQSKEKVLKLMIIQPQEHLDYY
jgi:hypothetical protein